MFKRKKSHLNTVLNLKCVQRSLSYLYEIIMFNILWLKIQNVLKILVKALSI